MSEPNRQAGLDSVHGLPSDATLSLPPGPGGASEQSTRPGPEVFARLAESADETANFPAAAGPAPLPAPPVGFVLEHQIGTGGMGVVYLARQQGLNRAVAIKTVRPGVRLDEKQLIRFLAEAEAVAAVRHPNVVEVYSFGELDGRPYLVLEFCPGGDLGAVAKADLPRTEAAFRRVAGLMAGVADGVQAAHAVGIVHRDLKPANVLLAADGTPKVTDFGLAKRGAGSDLTQTQAVMGTPAYMSPEQAGGGSKFVGPESDVWSLGVMLYELLCGQRPFAGDTPLEVISRVVGGGAPAVRGRCPDVPADLALITHKCLSREPRERYATAGELAADLRRWLAGEPILARPPGLAESAVRWARRNPKVAGSLAAAVAALVVGTAVSVGFGLWALAEADEAKRQKEITLALEREAAEQRLRTDEEVARAVMNSEVNAFVRDVFGAADPTGLSSSGLMPPGDAGRKVPAAELLTRGIADLRGRRFRGTGRADRLTRAALLDAVGDTARSLGLLKEAGPLLEEAVAIRDELLPDGHPDRRLSRYNLGCFYAENGDLLDAERVLTALHAEHKANGTADTAAAADVCYRLAGTYMAMEDERAGGYAREAVRIRQRVFGEKHRQTAIVRLVLAAAHFGEGETADGLAAMKPALEVFTAEGVTNDPTVRAAIEYQAGVTLRNSGFPALAVGKFQRALAMLRESLGTEHVYLALALADLGLAHRDAGQPAEAEDAFRQAVALCRKTVGLEHPKVLTLIDAYARLLVKGGKKDEAWGLAAEAVQASTRRYGTDAPWRVKLLATAAGIAARCGRPDEAAKLGEQAVAEYRRRPAHHDHLAELAFQLDGLADLEPARAAYAELFAAPADRWTPAERWEHRHNWATALAARKLYAEAEPLLRASCDAAGQPELKGKLEADTVAYSFECLGRAEWHAGRHAAAEERFRAAVAHQERAKSPTYARNRYAHLVRLLAVRRAYAGVGPVAEKYARQSNVRDVDAAWARYLRAATAAEGERKGLAEGVEKAFGKSSEPFVAAYRARAVVALGGDAGREADRLDALFAAGVKSDHVFLARAACALAAGKPAEPFLAKVQEAKGDTPLARVHALFAAAAAHRKDPSDATRAALRDELARADAHLEAAKQGTDPDVSGYAVSHLLELNHWAERVWAELKAEPK